MFHTQISVEFVEFSLKFEARSTDFDASPGSSQDKGFINKWLRYYSQKKKLLLPSRLKKIYIFKKEKIIWWLKKIIKLFVSLKNTFY